MTVPQANPYQGLGGGSTNGRYWQSYQATQSSALSAAYSAYVGTTIPQGALPAAPDPIEDAGIRAGEIEAVRVWLLKNGYLYSMFAHHVWTPGLVETFSGYQGMELTAARAAIAKATGAA